MSETTPIAVSGPPKQTQTWSSQYLPLPNVTGQAPINLCDAFCVGECPRSGVIILPPCLYPPTWEYRDNLCKLIKQSSLQNGGFELNRCRSDPIRKQTWLSCKKRLLYQDRTASPDKENYQKRPVNCGEMNQKEEYKAGVKRAVIVDKSKCNRGINGLKEKRRSQTNAAFTKEDKCSFTW